jgi:uncharacterized SAM-binding protein YcdF (DUF218 family)
MKIWKIIVFAVGVICCIDALIMSLFSNFNAGQIILFFASVAIILYAVFMDRVSRKIHIALGALCTIPLMLMVFLAVYGSLDNATYTEDVAIVLGAGIRGEEVSLTLAKRLDQTVSYFGKNPRAVIIVCGGKGSQESITEALAMERYLIKHGVPKEKIIKEEKSASTYENIAFADEILKGYFPQGYSSALITNAFHVYRASRIAQNAGISASHIGAPTVWYILPANYFREIFAVAKFWVM